MFDQAVIEKLDYYVYFLQDPRTGKIFYVGKGKENRIFAHLDGAIETNGKSEKLGQIREIISSGNEVKHFILRHGMSENTAFEVEASLIDFVGMENLSNLQGGHYSSDFGIKTTEEITAMYHAKNFQANDPIILININKLYDRKMTSEQLYEATRKSWVVGGRKQNAKFAIPTYQGLTREVYEIKSWFKVPEHGSNRWGFNGILANNEIREKYRYMSIKSDFPKGASNPIKYINC